MSADPQPEFDRIADNYQDLIRESIRVGGQEHDYYLKVKAEILLQLKHKFFADTKIAALDFGCGVGLMDQFLVDQLPGLCGTDLSQDSVEQAQKRNPDVAYNPCKSADLPYDAACFDMVFAVCVFHHIDPAVRTQCVAEIKRVLKPGGLFVIMEHNPWNPGTQLVVNRCEFDKDAVLLRRRRAASLLTAGGFEDVFGRYFLVTPWQHRAAQKLESICAQLPIGAQYFVAGTVPESGA